MSRVNAIYHIVINTHNRQMTIRNDHREDLYRFIWKIIKNNDCVLYRINGMLNHLHILLDLKPTMALSDLVRQIKQSSSEFARTCGFFPDWNGWGKEYAAFSVSYEDRLAVVDYIKGQQEHHAKETFEEEFKLMALKNGITWSDYLLT